MSPEFKSRVRSFLEIFFAEKESERLLQGVISLEDLELEGIIDSIKRYELVHAKPPNDAQDTSSLESISVEELAKPFYKESDTDGISNEYGEHDSLFDSALASLVEQLINNDPCPLAVRVLTTSTQLNVEECIRKMDFCLGMYKRSLLNSELPLAVTIPKEKRAAKKHEIVLFCDSLRANLIKSIEVFPFIWGKGQKEIAHLEPIHELGVIIQSAITENGLSDISARLMQCSAYRTLLRYEHPLMELPTLSRLVNQEELDSLAIDQTLWVLVNGMGRPGAKVISDRLRRPRQRLYTHLAVYIEHVVQSRSWALSSNERSRIYHAVESLIDAVPENASNMQLKMQDLAWRALLLSKAGDKERAGLLAKEAIDIARSDESSKVNEYLWWSRLGDAYAIAAASSGDPAHFGWQQCITCFNSALSAAFEDSKPLVLSRQAYAIAERVELYKSTNSEAEQEQLFALARAGVEVASMSVKLEKNSARAISTIYTRARNEAVLALVAHKSAAEDAFSLESKFIDSVERILHFQPTHWNAIRLVVNYHIERGDIIDALDWMDARIALLRENESDSHQKLADFLEIRSVLIALDYGLEDNARDRLIKTVSMARPKHSEARALLRQLSSAQDNASQGLYAQAMKKAPGSEERADFAKSALLHSEQLTRLDPNMSDVVVWTRHARLLIFLDEFDSAISILETLLMGFPNDPYVNFHLGEAYYKKGRASCVASPVADSGELLNIAIKAFMRAWELRKRVDTAHQLSLCWGSMGDISSQFIWLKKAEELDSSNGWTKFSLGWAAYKGGDLSAAFSYWVDAVQCASLDNNKAERLQTIAQLAARAIVRYGHDLRSEELNLQHLNANAIRLVASAASGAGWRRPRVIESFESVLDRIPAIGLKRIPHAVRAHLLFLQLTGGDEFANPWHARWYRNFLALKDRSLFIEYLAGGRGVFRRAASWITYENIGVRLREVVKHEARSLNLERWSGFIQAVTGEGRRDDYYRNAYQMFPAGDLGCEELYSVMKLINGVLFGKALGELGVGVPTERLSGAPVVFSGFLVEPEIFPAIELDSRAPEAVLVQADSLALQILIDSVGGGDKGTKGVASEKDWVLNGDSLVCSLKHSSGFAASDYEILASVASRDSNVSLMSTAEGVDVFIRTWS
jgi:tetratricopeptide (TPR) repeat protein